MSKKLHESMYAVPSPATVGDIVSGYGWHAPHERWPDLSRRQLKSIYAASTPAGGICPGQPHVASGAWIPPSSILRRRHDCLAARLPQCGLAAHGAYL